MNFSDLSPKRSQQLQDELVLNGLLESTLDQRVEALGRVIDWKEVERDLKVAGWEVIPIKEP